MLCREPEKGTVFDWRAKLKEEEKDNDPKNMWKKFDSAGPMKAIYQLPKVCHPLVSKSFELRLCAFSTCCVINRRTNQFNSRHRI